MVVGHLGVGDGEGRAAACGRASDEGAHHTHASHRLTSPPTLASHNTLLFAIAQVLLLIPKEDPPTLSGEEWSPGFRDFISQCLQMDARQRPTAKELLRHRWIRNAKRTSSLSTLVERYEKHVAERPPGAHPAQYNSNRNKPAYSAPAVLAPDGSWDFGPPTPDDSGWDFGEEPSDRTPLATAASLARDVAISRIDSDDRSVGAPSSSAGGTCGGSGGGSGGSGSSSSSGGGATRFVGEGLHSQPAGSGGRISGRDSQRRSAELLAAVREGSEGSSAVDRPTSSSSSAAAAASAASSSSSSNTASVVPLVVAPVLARMLGVHQDKQVQKAIAQLKLAFDNLERQKPSLSRDLLGQMFEYVVCSNNPDVNSLIPRQVTAALSGGGPMHHYPHHPHLQQPPPPPGGAAAGSHPKAPMQMGHPAQMKSGSGSGGGGGSMHKRPPAGWPPFLSPPPNMPPGAQPPPSAKDVTQPPNLS